MMILSDFHMHTHNSQDSDAPMKSMIEASIDKGLKYICFTEHMDYDFPYDNPADPDSYGNPKAFQVDTDDYLEEYLKMRDEYKERIALRFGIELGLQPHLAKTLSDYVDSYPFDFIIASTHLVDRKDVYYPGFFEGRSEDECYRRYFEATLENVTAFSDYDVYGHLDYIVRYGPNRDKFYSYKKYGDIIDEILKKIIEAGHGIEINTGAFRSGLTHPNPTEDILYRYRELKGEIITVGADAHSPQHVAHGFSRVPSILYDAGFKYYTVFKGRKSEFIRL